MAYINSFDSLCLHAFQLLPSKIYMYYNFSVPHLHHYGSLLKIDWWMIFSKRMCFNFSSIYLRNCSFTTVALLLVLFGFGRTRMCQFFFCVEKPKCSRLLSNLEYLLTTDPLEKWLVLKRSILTFIVTNWNWVDARRISSFPWIYRFYSMFAQMFRSFHRNNALNAPHFSVFLFTNGFFFHHTNTHR